MPKSGRDIIDLAGANPTAADRRKFRKIGLAFDAKQAELTLANHRIQELEAQIKRIRAKKQKAIPNTNQRFMQLGDIIGGEREAGNALIEEIVVLEEEPAAEIKVVAESIDDEEEVENDLPAEVCTCVGRATRVLKRYTD